MSSSDWVAVAAAVVVALLVVGLFVALTILARSVRALQQEVERLERETIPALHDARRAVRQASGEVERVDALLTSATSVTNTVDSASRFAYRAMSSPVVKALAFGEGTRRAVRRLRQPVRD
jgi:predicted Holliday junction resolvase-like endonuclease